MTFTLPDAFRTVAIQDHLGREFQVVVSKTPDHYEDWLETSRPFSAIAKIFVALLDGRGCLVDVGANIGTISLPVAKSGSRVVAIEMLPFNCLKLNLATQVNALPRMSVVQAAATNAVQMLEFSGDGPWAAVTAGGAAPQYATGYPVDDILEMLGDSFPAGDLAVKIDVEGHELEVLQGATRTIASYRPVIIFESIEGLAAENSRASRKLLQEAGYTLLMTRDALPSAILSPRRAEDLQIGFLTDYVAVPNEKLDATLARLSAFPIRDLTDEEKTAWVLECAESQQLVAHRVHAALVARDLEEQGSEKLRKSMQEVLSHLSQDVAVEVKSAVTGQ